MQRWVLLGHALLVGLVTAAVLLLPWFVAHGLKTMPPAHAAVAAGICALSAMVLILLVVQRWGVPICRLEGDRLGVVDCCLLERVGAWCDGDHQGEDAIQTT